MRTASEVAREEVFARVMTLDQAKESYKKWVKDALALGGQSDEVVRFWNDVLSEIDKIEFTTYIEEAEPTLGQRILYQGNLGLIEGTFVSRQDGVGKVLLDSGEYDYFDMWRSI